MRYYLIKKEKNYDLYIYICLFFFLPVTYIERILESTVFFPIGRVLLCTCSFILYFFRGKISLNLIFIFFFSCMMNISTFFYGGSIASAVYGHFYLLLGICCFVEYHLEKSQLLILYYRYCFFWIVLNLFSIVIWPSGMFIAPGDGGEGINFLLGNYNSFIKFILPALGIGYFLLDQKKISKRQYFFLWMCVIVTYSLVNSVTSKIGVLIFGIFLLLFNRHIFSWGVNPIFSVCIMTSMTSVFALFPVKSLQTKLAEITGKSVTFSGRTLLWERMVKEIKNSPILGHGIQNGEFLMEKFQLQYAGEAHNLIIQILYQNGIVGILLFLFIFFSISYCFFRKTDGKTKRALKCVLLVMLVMSCFDFYSYIWMFQMFLIISYCMKQSNLNKLSNTMNKVTR